MQWVDLVMLGILAISVIVGLVRGFVFEVLSLAGWLVAYLVARWFAADVAVHIPVGKPGSAVNHAVGFVALFIAVLLLWAIVSRLLRFLIHASPLSLPDRALGAGFGLLRGLVLLLAAATVIMVTPLAKSPPWRASQGAQWLHSALDGLRPLLPPQLSTHLPNHVPAASGGAR
ncbi:CvpA family protein [Rhizobacter sp. J219]|jgi:membrane protein required for colicin V production|uniref:CvpA family protein n=1 Tax=Rhizobacter sp. J219 TaxID=2898430 RepID=UPI002151F649|nr:CvpA family protein [Rhizobacter sp. J219]MCR5882989.1 CvpA family protein [Rhizobacter sp. J219]